MAEGKGLRRRRAGPAGRASGKSARAALGELEQRVARLEGMLGNMLPSKNKPAQNKPAPRRGPRCPGCRLAVASIGRGRCEHCGFDFDALAELKRPRRRSS